MSHLQQYVPMVDAILSVSDLEQITVKKIRNALQALFVVDLQANKKELADLIMERYYKLVEEREQQEQHPENKGNSNTEQEEGEEDDSGDSILIDAGPVKKKVKKQRKKKDLGDEEIAANLHASLNSRPSRARNGSPKKAASKKRKRIVDPNKPKSDTGFRRPMRMSPQLREFLEVETDTIPRTEVVKKTWDYIKKHNLQNPSDKREILCDEAMEPVFGKKTTMFQMNKHISKHLYPLEEDEGKN